jgi:hypothetical protein
MGELELATRRQLVLSLVATITALNGQIKQLQAQIATAMREHRTLGRAWCRIVWRCWQDRVPYDPARHRALQQHITVTIPTLSGPVVDHPATQRMHAGAFATATNPREQEVTAAP